MRNHAQPLEAKTENQRWPTVIFSHGLGGSRNAYSHICGTLASHGIIVIAPEHRDGSAPVTYIQTSTSKKPRPLFYRRITHTPSPEVFEHRDKQLKIRLWEMGLIHDAVTKIDCGELEVPPVLSQTNREQGELREVLASLAQKLDIHEPGKLVFAGHSFGAATCVQFTKSVYYNRQSDDPAYSPLYSPDPDSALTRQVTPDTPLLLLDMWAVPLRSPSTEWLWSQPLPCYHSPHGASNVLTILSEAFFKWRDNLSSTKRALSEDPTRDSGEYARTKTPAAFFYPAGSAHLSQSDFGVLFPNVTRMAFKCDEPERALLLNARAMLQTLRCCGYAVAPSAKLDEEESKANADAVELSVEEPDGDWRILAPTGGIRGWVAVELDGEPASDSDGSVGSAGSVKLASAADAAGMAEGEVLGDVVAQRA
ncbi:MAG: hypothetical protein INR71_02385 [Terriglobus roseus]|nr:hypothetical protein [Terriglobus roseus]